MSASLETDQTGKGSLPGKVFRDLRKSLKYRHLCDATLRRFSREAAKRFSAEKPALQWAKKKLHQSFGAFMPAGGYRRIDALIGRLSGCSSLGERKDLCRQILACHVSTRERLPLLEELYPKVYRITGKPKRVVDLACGLNPFSLPWMDLDAAAEYLAVDSDCRLVESANAFFIAGGFAGKADCDDLLSIGPQEGTDLILLLKTLPCLERQHPGAGAEIMRNLRSRHILVSFPTRTLGGRRKGLPESYRKYAEGLAAELQVPVARFAYPSELFYLFDRG